MATDFEASGAPTMLELFNTHFDARDTLRFVEEKGRVGLWSYELRGGRLEWSRGMFALLGCDPGSVEPSLELFTSFVHPDDRAVLRKMDEAVHAGRRLEFEVRCFPAQGGIRWLATRGEVLFDRDGRPSRAVGVVMDVTHRHEALKALEAHEERQRALLAAIAELVWTARPDGSVVEAADWCKLTGQSPDEVTGSGWIDALHPEDRARVETAWQQAVASGIPYAAEFRLRRADGEYRWHRSRGAPVLDGHGSPWEWVGVAIDIHDQKTGGTLYPLRAQEQTAITGAQLRAARGILNWSVRDLSEASKVSAATIRRIEEINGIPTNADGASPALRDALERHGVEFLFPSIGKPAVRLR